MNADAEMPMPEGEEPPPRGVRAMAVVRWLMLALAALAAVGSWWSYAAAQRDGATAPAPAVKYRCPMHPQIVADQPGECPICHMTLEPFTPEPTATATATPTAGPPPGTAPVDLALDRVQRIGVRTALAVERTSSRPIRVTATVAAPEESRAEVHVRTAGFVERLVVSQSGVAVGRGQLLFTAYSPEIFQAQNELLVARRWAGDGGRSETLDAARRKLALLGMDEREIARVEETGETVRAIGVHAPLAGHVTRKGIVQGSYVTPDAVLFEIQDLSRVWIVADVPQAYIPDVRVGTTGTFALARTSDAKATVRVDLVYPSVDPQARTTRVRMPIVNEGMRLRPGDFGTVEIAAAARTQLFVPRDALVDTGKATYVFVVEHEGRYAPRSVVVEGAEGDEIAVRSGLAPGERVVSGATFLIDAESRLRASLAPAHPPGHGDPADGAR